MAEFAEAGFPLDETLTDVRTTYHDRVILLECKRPQRETSIHANLRDAANQLAKQPRNQVHGALKLIALSFSKILTAEAGILGAPSGQIAGEYVSNSIERLVDPHLKFMASRGEDNVAGILAYGSMSAIEGDTGNSATVMKQVFFTNPIAGKGATDALETWFKEYSSSAHPNVEYL